MPEVPDRAASVSAYVGLISAVQTLEQTHGKKQALYHMPGWLTLAEQVQTPCHAKVLKNTCKQVMSFAPSSVLAEGVLVV